MLPGPDWSIPSGLARRAHGTTSERMPRDGLLAAYYPGTMHHGVAGTPPPDSSALVTGSWRSFGRPALAAREC
jgi:hypothetical protein